MAETIEPILQKGEPEVATVVAMYNYYLTQKMIIASLTMHVFALDDQLQTNFGTPRML